MGIIHHHQVRPLPSVVRARLGAPPMTAHSPPAAAQPHLLAVNGWLLLHRHHSRAHSRARHVEGRPAVARRRRPQPAVVKPATPKVWGRRPPPIIAVVRWWTPAVKVPSVHCCNRGLPRRKWVMGGGGGDGGGGGAAVHGRRGGAAAHLTPRTLHGGCAPAAGPAGRAGFERVGREAAVAADGWPDDA